MTFISLLFSYVMLGHIHDIKKLGIEKLQGAILKEFGNLVSLKNLPVLWQERQTTKIEEQSKSHSKTTLVLDQLIEVGKKSHCLGTFITPFLIEIIGQKNGAKLTLQRRSL